MAQDWFRTQDWDTAARDDFEARLARARPYNRPQYLRIKALSLRESGLYDDAADLLYRVLRDTTAYTHEKRFARELLGDIAATRGDYAAAETLYRQILDEPSTSGTTGSVEIALAETLLGRPVPAYDEAGELLGRWIETPGLKFDDVLFRWYVAFIRVAEQAGETDEVRRAARVALDLAERGPQLPRHGDVGVVHTTSDVLDRLRVQANDTGPAWRRAGLARRSTRRG